MRTVPSGGNSSRRGGERACPEAWPANFREPLASDAQVTHRNPSLLNKADFGVSSDGFKVVNPLGKTRKIERRKPQQGRARLGRLTGASIAKISKGRLTPGLRIRAAGTAERRRKAHLKGGEQGRRLPTARERG